MSGLQLGPARGGRKPAKLGLLEIEFVRELTGEDKHLLENPGSVGSVVPVLTRLRNNHHQVARLLAQGMPLVEIGLISGMGVARISHLSNNDPSFMELVEHYKLERDIIQEDVVKKMTVLGSSAIDELSARLEENPEKLSARELMELADLTLIKGRQGVAGGSGQGPGGPGGVQVNVVFGATTRVIEGEKG